MPESRKDLRQQRREILMAEKPKKASEAMTHEESVAASDYALTLISLVDVSKTRSFSMADFSVQE